MAARWRRHALALKSYTSTRRRTWLPGLGKTQSCRDLGTHPIRWITEDARKFVQRELKRENFYDAVILDPPSYGHGPKGEVFQLADDLLPLLADCGTLTAGRRAFILMTCHSPGYGPAELEACLADAVLGTCSAGARASTLDLQTADRRRLNAGVSVRWPGE